MSVPTERQAAVGAMHLQIQARVRDMLESLAKADSFPVQGTVEFPVGK